MPVVAMPDGSRVKFPDDMPPDQIKGFIRQKFPDAVPPANPAEGQGSMLDSIANGVTLGFGDEAAGAIGGALDWMGFGPEGSKGTFQGGYDRVTGNVRNAVKDYQTRHPVAATVAEVAGSLPTMMLVPGGTAMKGLSLAGKVARGAASGAAVGGLQGFGNAEGGVQNRLEGAAEGAGTGAVVGAALPAVGRGVARVVGKRVGKAAVPTLDDLETASNDLRDQAKSIGLTIKPQAYDSIAADVANVARQAGVDEGVSPTAYKAMQRVLSERPAVQGINGSPMTLERMDIIRKVLGNASREKGADFKTTPSAAIATKMLQRFDARMNMLGANDALSGNPQAANGLIKQSRQLWARKIKADTIQRAIEYGSEAASGAENGIRNEFRKLLKPGKYNWTPDEKKAIQKVVQGGFGGNVLRFLGTFGLPIDQGRAWLGPLLGASSGGLAGGAAGGPVGAAAGILLPIAGTAAKLGSRALTGRKAGIVDSIVRNGGTKPFDDAAALTAERRVDQVLIPAGRAAVPLINGKKRAPLKVWIGQPSPGYK